MEGRVEEGSKGVCLEALVGVQLERVKVSDVDLDSDRLEPGSERVSVALVVEVLHLQDQVLMLRQVQDSEEQHRLVVGVRVL